MTTRSSGDNLTATEHVGLSFILRGVTMPVASCFRFLVTGLKVTLKAIKLKEMAQ